MTNTIFFKGKRAKMTVSFLLLCLVIPAAALIRFPRFTRIISGSATKLFDFQPDDFPLGGAPLGEKKNSEEEQLIKERVSGLNSDASGMLLSDISDYGIRLALSEEHISLGNIEEAKKLAIEAMKISDHVRQPDSVFHAYAEGVLGDAYYKHGEFETAANHYHSALKSYERHYRSETGPESLELVGATQLVAWNLLSEGQYREASFAWSSALGLTQRLEGPNSTTTAGCMVNLAVSYMNLGDLGQAPEFLLTKALRVFEEDDRTTEEKFEPFKEKNIEPIANTNTILGHLYYQRGEDVLASERYERVVEMYEEGLVDGPCAVSAIQQLGMLEWSRGKTQQAEELLESALAIRELVRPSPGLQSKRDQKAAEQVKKSLASLRKGEKAPRAVVAAKKKGA